MGDNKLEEIIRLQRMYHDLSEFEKQQAKEDLAEFQGKTKKVILKAHASVKSLYKAADKLDEVWKDCKIAHTAGNTAGIVGGILTIGGGIATILTAGVATPLLVVGIGFGFAGAGTNLGTSIAEAVINSTEIKKAEEDLKETFDCINNVKNTVQLWLDRKEEARLLNMFCLAVQTLELSDTVFKLLQQVISCVTGIPVVIVEAATRIYEEVGKAGAKAAGRAAKQSAGRAGAQAAGKAGAQAAGKAGVQAAGDAAESGAKAGTKAGAKLAGGLIIGVSLFFLLVDAVDLGFTIRDLVEKKGSKAAEVLRREADALKKLL
ncbi:uncharacterized protein LOC144638861 [Oculina patagonica]